jgi:hypothetical protein
MQLSAAINTDAAVMTMRDATLTMSDADVHAQSEKIRINLHRNDARLSRRRHAVIE